MKIMLRFEVSIKSKHHIDATSCYNTLNNVTTNLSKIRHTHDARPAKLIQLRSQTIQLCFIYSYKCRPHVPSLRIISQCTQEFCCISLFAPKQLNTNMRKIPTKQPVILIGI